MTKSKTAGYYIGVDIVGQPIYVTHCLLKDSDIKVI